MSGVDVAEVPGSGAAGGIAAALLAVGARLEPGFERLALEIGLAPLIAGADLVITGEGSVDAQTAMGKAPAGVARLARDAGAVVVALGGRVDRSATQLDDVFDAIFCIHGEPRTASVAMDPDVTRLGLTTTAANVMRLFSGAAGGHRA
jgi:glycerate kinase